MNSWHYFAMPNPSTARGQGLDWPSKGKVEESWQEYRRIACSEVVGASQLIAIACSKAALRLSDAMSIPQNRWENDICGHFGCRFMLLLRHRADVWETHRKPVVPKVACNAESENQLMRVFQFSIVSLRAAAATTAPTWPRILWSQQV